MNYAQQDFLNLISAVEVQGGELQERRCQGRTIRQQPKAGVEAYVANTTGCRKQAIFEIPYLDDSDVDLADEKLFKPVERKRQTVGGFGGAKTEDQSVIVCAIDDAIGLWPRFAGVVSEDSTEPI